MAVGLIERLVKAKRVTIDAGILYEVFTRDMYNKVEYKIIDKTGKALGELGF